MELNQSNLEESVLRRTICITEVPEWTTEESLVGALDKYGEIQYLRLDSIPGSTQKVALVQYADEGAAEAAIVRIHLQLDGGNVRVGRSSITIEVIPPTDAVFGKPMTVGRHVMAVNHSRDQRGRKTDHTRKVQKAREAAVAVLQKLSRKTGWVLPEGAIRALLSEEPDIEGPDDQRSRSRMMSYETPRSRSRSVERHRRRHQSDRRRY
jgi:hypothetical protein